MGAVELTVSGSVVERLKPFVAGPSSELAEVVALVTAATLTGASTFVSTALLDNKLLFSGKKLKYSIV